MSWIGRLSRKWRCSIKRRNRQVGHQALGKMINTHGGLVLTAITAVSAPQFVDSIGINTHFGKSSGMYTNPNLQTTLGSLGIKHLRDNTGNTTAVSRLNSLYSTYGIKTTMVVDWTPLAISQRVAWLEENWAEAIEGLNEPAHQTRSYAGLLDTTYPSVTQLATRQYQFDLYNAVKANPLTVNKPVLSPAQAFTVFTETLGDIPFDVLAFHRYAGGVNMPESMHIFGEDFHDLDSISHTHNEPIWMTETGYQTAQQEVHPRYGVSDTAQAKYLPRNLVHAYMQGVDRIYLYELADEGDDETYAEHHFGIVQYNANTSAPLTLKPAGQALQRLIDHLNDSTSSSFTPGTLDFTIDAGTASMANLKYLLLQENDAAGTYNLLLWQDVLSFDAANQQDISNTPLNVVVRFNDVVTAAKVYNLNSDSPVTTYGTTKSVVLSVPDEIVLIQITKGSGTPGGTLPILEVTATDPVAVEGTSDTGTFTFTRTGSTSSAYTFWVEILGDATDAVDYVDQYTSVTFNAGSSTATKTITPINDSLAEGTETVIMRIWGNSTHTVGNHWSAAVKIIDDESQADLTVTDITWSPVDPNPGDEVTFYVTVKNQGTQPTSANASLYVQPGYSWGTRLYATVNSGLAADTSTVVTLPGHWDAEPGFSVPKAGIDYTLAVQETDEDNNYSSKLLAIPFASRKDDFESGLDTTAFTGWDITGNWTIVSYGGNTVLENQDTASSYASPMTTYLPSTFATQWSCEFDYDWRWGGSASQGYGFHSLTISQDLLNDQSNGYRIVVHQGDSNSGSNTNKVIQIYQVDSGVVAGTPLAEGAGYNQCGFKSVGQSTPRYKPIKIAYDQIAGTLGVYGDADGDGVLELFAQVQGGMTYDRINRITLNTTTTATCAPVIDNVKVKLFNPIDQMSDDFNANTNGNPPASWYVAGNWSAATYSGNVVIENTDTTTGGRYVAKGWSLPYDAAWEASMDYDWKWGGSYSGGYGAYHQYGYMDVLDPNGNGYRLMVRQGNGNNASYTNQVIQLYRRDAWTVTDLLGSSAGYNQPGWASRSLSGPDLKRVTYAYEPSTQTFTVSADLDGDGKLEQLISVTDTGLAHQDLTSVYIGAEGFQAAERFTLDNVRVSQLHMLDIAP